MLIALLFFAFNIATFADGRAQRFYQVGYEYSQNGQNKDAFRWMLRAAKAGYVPAQNNIGLSYLYGLGVKQNEHQAFRWFEKAAKQGLSYAQSELAMLYYLGKGVEKNVQAAHDWWLIAAQQNDEYAQFNLASLLLELGNNKQAIEWFQEAETNHHPQAGTALKALNVSGEKYVK